MGVYRTGRGLAGIALVLLALSAEAPAAVCGNGIVESNEECDPGGTLYCNGDPSLGRCTTGAQCAGGVNCYYAGSCCKFNCQYVGEGADCSDGNECTGPDTCNNVGECIGNALSGSSCDDGLFCTTGDTCNQGECTGDLFVPAECNDGDPCTDDGCDLEGGCTHTFNTAPCDDGVLCTTGDVCSDGSCSGTLGVPAACDDGNECTDDGCNPNGNGGAGACTHANNTGSCDDGQLCTQNDTCADGECNGTPYVPAVCDDENVCTDDSCNPLGAEGAGTCTNVPNTDPCDDSEFCTENDTCSGGECIGETRTCDDDNSCTTDSCNEATDACVNDVTGGIGDSCDDNDVCTTGTTCDAMGGCSGGAAIDCSDGIACTADTCHPLTGCRNVPDQEGRDCLDSCWDGIDNDTDDGIDFEDDGCATLAAVQRFAVISTRERSRRGLFAGSDVSVDAVDANGTCNTDDHLCDCGETAPLACLSLDLPCATDADCVTAVAGVCNSSTNTCDCPIETPGCQALGRPCSSDEDCDVAPFPRGPSQAGVCGYSSDVRAGTHFGFFTSSGDVKFGKGATLDRTLDLAKEFATDGGTVTIRKTSAPLVGPDVCSSDPDLACTEDADCPAAVEICFRGQCTGHDEACDSNADCAPACDYRRRVDDGYCVGDTGTSCVTDGECLGLGGSCVHPFVSTDGSSENFLLCDGAIALDPNGPPDTSALLLAINRAIAAYVPGPGEAVDMATACEACPTPETPDGDSSCIPCPDQDEVRTRKDYRKVTIEVGSGLQVLDLRRVRLSGNTVMRINGQDDTILVVRVDRNLRLGGEAQVTLGSNGTGNGTLRVENTLWNVQNRQGGQPNFIRNGLFQGTVLAPERTGIRVGSEVRVEGALFSKKIHIGGPSTIVHVPFTALLPVVP